MSLGTPGPWAKSRGYHGRFRTSLSSGTENTDSCHPPSLPAAQYPIARQAIHRGACGRRLSPTSLASQLACHVSFPVSAASSVPHGLPLRRCPHRHQRPRCPCPLAEEPCVIKTWWQRVVPGHAAAQARGADASQDRPDTPAAPAAELGRPSHCHPGCGRDTAGASDLPSQRATGASVVGCCAGESP